MLNIYIYYIYIYISFIELFYNIYFYNKYRFSISVIFCRNCTPDTSLITNFIRKIRVNFTNWKNCNVDPKMAMMSFFSKCSCILYTVKLTFVQLPHRINVHAHNHARCKCNINPYISGDNVDATYHEQGTTSYI